MALRWTDACAYNRCGEWFMDAKYNFIIDSVTWRIGLNLAGFALWLTAVVGLFAAVKL